MSRKFFFSSRLHAALVAVATALVVAAPAEAQAVTGGKLFATGGTVDVVVQQGGITSYTSRLFLLRPDGTRDNIALNTDVGKHVTAWAIPYGPGARVRDHPAQRRPNFLHGPSETEPGRHHTRRRHGYRRGHVPGRLRGHVRRRRSRLRRQHLPVHRQLGAEPASSRGRPNPHKSHGDSKREAQRAPAEDPRGPAPVAEGAAQAVRQAVHKSPRTSHTVLLPTSDREGALPGSLEHQAPSLFGQRNDVEGTG